MSASRNLWAPGLKVAAFACVLCAPLSDSELARNTIRGTRSTLLGRRAYSFGTETRRVASSGSKVLNRPRRPDAQGIQPVPPPCPKASRYATE